MSPHWRQVLVLLAFLCAASCSSSRSGTSRDGSVDRSSVDSSAPDRRSADATIVDVRADLNTIDVPAGSCGYPLPENTCTPPSTLCLPCGHPGLACCSSGPGCYCQDYGRELCLGDPFNPDGRAGDECRSDGSCDPGLVCLQFGINKICQECGLSGEPCCDGSMCQGSLSCHTSCDKPVCY
jgi:hypothetical protein